MTQPTLPAMTSHKAVAAGIGAGLTALFGILDKVAPFVPQPWGSIITGVLAVGTLFGVYGISNKPK